MVTRRAAAAGPGQRQGSKGLPHRVPQDAWAAHRERKEMESGLGRWGPAGRFGRSLVQVHQAAGDDRPRLDSATSDFSNASGLAFYSGVSSPGGLGRARHRQTNRHERAGLHVIRVGYCACAELERHASAGSPGAPGAGPLRAMTMAGAMGNAPSDAPPPRPTKPKRHSSATSEA
jgi:hypothetical protein